MQEEATVMESEHSSPNESQEMQQQAAQMAAEATESDQAAAPPADNGARTESAASDSSAEAPPGAAAVAFAAFGLSDAVQSGIAELGYSHATDVQQAAIPPALRGQDLVVQAKTGSGKTSAFGIPTLERVEPKAAQANRPLALVLVPTRELAHQVAAEVKRLGSAKGTRIAAIYGGVSIGRQASVLKRGVDLVVGTPGRLLDHYRRGNLKLDHIQLVVLDEADEMLSMGFWDDVTDLLDLAPTAKQTLLFSATLPYQIAKAAASYLQSPERIDVSGDNLTVEGIENSTYHVQSDIPKPRQLLYLLETERPASAVIFCNTRNETEMIAKFLTSSGFVAEAISGSFRQRDRQRVMDRIKSGDLRYMVATDIAARGIDINDLSHVFNYSLPEYPEVYLHRVGRTGRVGKMGHAISLVDGKGLMTLSVLERQFGITFSERALPPEDEVLKRRSERIMKDLMEKAAVSEISQHLPAAEEILANESERDQIVAYLLKSYFGVQAQQQVSAQKPEAQKQEAKPTPSKQQQSDKGANNTNKNRRRRRRRPRRATNGERQGGDDGMQTMDAAEALAKETASTNEAGANDDAAQGGANKEAQQDGLSRIRVNVGYDDGFKGRGAVAKKISALAGLNDGTLREIESRRQYAVLKATPEVAELIRDRVDGAQIGKKILTVAIA